MEHQHVKAQEKSLSQYYIHGILVCIYRICNPSMYLIAV